MKMSHAVRLALLLPLLLLLPLGCRTIAAPYHGQQFSPSGRLPRIDGKCLIANSAGDAAYLHRSTPQGRFGSAITLEMPLGRMSQDIGGSLARAVFSGGCDEFASPGSGRYAATFRTRILDYKFWYNNIDSYLGGAAQVNLEIEISASDSGGLTLLQRTYRSTQFRQRREVRDGEKYSAVITALTVQAFNDNFTRFLADLRHAMPSVTGADSPLERKLEELRLLREKNVITEEEFREMRLKALDEWR